MIAPYKITYSGFSSLDMDCWTGLAFDSDDGDVETHLTREAQISESYNGSRNRIHGYRWSEPFTFQVTFTKQDYSDFTSEENRKMLKWLTGNPNASFVDIYMDDSEVVEWSSLGNWINVSQYKNGNEQIIGYVAEWEAAHPWALSPLYTITKDITKEIDVTMYYWTSTLVGGSPIPQYLLTQVQTPKVGTIVYSVKNQITESVIKEELAFYGAISEVTTDGSYVVNNTKFKLTQQGTKIKRTYDNKITVDLETDEPQSAVYPRITIQQNDSNIITIDHAMNAEKDIWLDGTVYKYNDTYYWLDSNGKKHENTDAPTGINTTSVLIKNKHTDDYGNESVFYSYVKNNTTGEKVVLDGANRVVSSSSTRIFGDDFSWDWIHLYEGKNELSFVGNCTVTIEFRHPIKCGEF